VSEGGQSAKHPTREWFLVPRIKFAVEENIFGG